MKTIAQHTCGKSGGYGFVMKHSPFCSLENKDTGSLPFLGIGYYYWERNRKMAHYWGKKHYSQSYYIVESHLNINDSVYFDLLGSLEQMEYFRKLVRMYSNGSKKLILGEFIEFLKRLDNPGIFPFKCIRSIDSSSSVRSRWKIIFSKGKNNYTDLNPRVVIYYIDKQYIETTRKEIVQ